jgi:DNA-directed RNA polymerase sigma subunit (sigma70/sigma32)
MEKFKKSAMVVRVYLSLLPEKYRKVIKLRYGIEDGKEWTLEECAQFFGCSRQNVKKMQLRAEAIMKEVDKGLTN